MCTWHCASSKDTEAVQQNSEVDLKTHQIFLYGELLEDLSLDEGIGLQTFGVLHSDLQAVGCSAEDGVVFEGDRFQYVGQVASIVHAGHQNILLIVGLRLG